ncbi:MAG: hypothetical protein H5T69_04245 [Chloroflexi bacterium]|nr:hypothetical protein [Chloroflexota bacterium]
MDDQKIFGWASKLEADFIIRVAHKPERPLWALVADDVSRNRQLILLTNVPILDKRSARTVYDAWRRCPHIEHTYRFDQERGLEVEDMQVHAVEHMRRLFTLVLIAALFVYYIANVWPEPAVRWLLDLGGKLHLKLDADGPYLLIAGIAAVFVTVATLSFATRFPFPRECLTCG